MQRSTALLRVTGAAGALSDALSELLAHIENPGSDFDICREIVESSYGRAADAALSKATGKAAT